MILGENTKMLIINNSLNEQLEVSYVEGDMSINPVKKEKRRWGKSSSNVITNMKCDINFNSLYTERKLEDWVGHSLLFQITLDAENNDDSYNIIDVDINNLKFDFKDKDIVKSSGSVSGILTETIPPIEAGGEIITLGSVNNDLQSHKLSSIAHGTTGSVVGTTDTQTLTNKRLDNPKINEDVQLTSTATQLDNAVTKLSGISADADKVESSLTNGNVKINDVETIIYAHPDTHSLDIITETANKKIMTNIERNKLTGIEDSANNYTHPSTHDWSIITGEPTTLSGYGITDGVSNQDFIANNLAISSGDSFVGYGYEPLGGVVHIDDDSPLIEYSVGDWIRGTGAVGRESTIFSKYTVSTNIGAYFNISFIGTDLWINCNKLAVSGIIGVSVDGGAETLIDLYSSIAGYAQYVTIATGLPFDSHQVKVTIRGKNPSATNSSLVIHFFEVMTTTDSTVKLAMDGDKNKSSAITLGNLNESSIDISQAVDPITNLVPNADFSRISPTWGTIFQDDFNRADGVVGNGWTAGSISGNSLSVSSGTKIYNGSLDWIDRQIKCSFVCPSSSYAGFIVKYTDNNNYIAGIVNNTSAKIYFYKVINGTAIDLINLTDYTTVAGTTYYVTLKSKDNIYSLSITNNVDYVTSATSIYLYEDNVKLGKIGLWAGTNPITYDSIVVTAPVPEGWSNSIITGVTTNYNNNIVKLINTLSIISAIAENISTSFMPSVTVGQQYTFSIKRKLSAYTSGNGAYIGIQWRQSDGTTVISNDNTSYVISIDSDYVIVSITATAPANAAYARHYGYFDGIGTCEWTEPMFVQGSTVPEFHTKESRCDLVSLQNDGNIVVTKGTGKSSLAYRVEAETGLISKFYRDKDECPHWDRVKIWRGGTWSTGAGSYSGGACISSNITNNTLYISFVGTGIDFITRISTNLGIIGVTLDNSSEVLVDLYSTSSITAQKVFLIRGLSYGQHQLKLRVTGTKNYLSGDIWIEVDAFDIYLPEIPDTPVNCQPLGAVVLADPDNGWIRYSENEGIVYSGTWSDSSNASYSNGVAKTNAGTDTTSYGEFSFIGNAIRLIAHKNTDLGKCDVLINDVTDQSGLDLYNSSVLYQQLVYTKIGLTLGLNKIKVKTTNSKNISSSGYIIPIDAFDVKSNFYIIDLRKFLNDINIKQKIQEHENKDIHEAHYQAIKGDVNKLRIERGDASVTGNITFSKSYTVPPIIYLGAKSTTLPYATSVTTTGFTLNGAGTYWMSVGY